MTWLALALVLAGDAGVLLSEGQYRAALPAAEQALEQAEQRGDEPAIASASMDLSEALIRMGRPEESRRHARRALELSEQLFGVDSGEAATAALQLAHVEIRLGQLEAAHGSVERALRIRERLLGADDPATAECLHEFALLHHAEGRYDEALSLSHDARSRQEAALGPVHIDVASSLNLEGVILIAQRRLEEAEAVLNRSLEIKRSVLRAGDPRIGATLNNLAVVADLAGNFKNAEALYLEAMSIEEAAYGEDHPHVATDANNLGVLYDAWGRFDLAEPLLRRALGIRQQRLGADHPLVAETLNNLGVVQRRTGRLAEAEESYRSALSIWENTLGPEHPRVAVALNNLSIVLTDREQDPAELLERSLAIGEAALGGEHPLVGFTLHHLGRHALKRDDLERAVPWLERSLSIWEHALGEMHPLTATACGSLAGARQKNGELEAAERLLRRAREIDETVFGTGHPRYGEVLIRLGRLTATRGETEAAHELLLEGTGLLLRARPAVLSLLTERQQLAYLHLQESPIHQLVELTIDHRAHDPRAVETAYGRWAAWKGSALTAQRELWDVATGSEAREVLDELRLTRQELARHWLRRPRSNEMESYRARSLKLELRLSRIEERALGRLAGGPVAATAGPVNAGRLAASLPADTILIDYAEIVGEGGTRRFVAFLVGAGEITLQDLGDAGPIEQAVEHYLHQIEAAAAPAPERRTARALFRLLLEPLLGRVGSFPQLLISPDGVLARLPFEVLQDREGRLILERFRVAYLPTPRDLLRARGTPATTSNRAVVLADPDYEIGSREDHPSAPDGDEVAAALTRDLTAGGFVRLPATADEGREVAGILEAELGLEVELNLGAAASESTLLAVASPRVLHLSAHGFFLDDPQRNAVSAEGWRGGLEAVDRGLPEAQWAGSLRRSGLALSGANASLRQGSDAGLVTAEKLLGLDLRQTELAVLSGCRTAAGMSRRGEGVFGLQRAFLVAGARSLILSLWPVDDQATRELMRDFYTRWAAGASKSEALRGARLALRRHHPHPRDWGAFVLVGSPD